MYILDHAILICRDYFSDFPNLSAILIEIIILCSNVLKDHGNHSIRESWSSLFK